MARVLVAMSGGVDSSVAAALLKQSGFDCVGVFMRVGQHVATTAAAAASQSAPICALPDKAAPDARRAAETPRRLRHGCCSADDADDARAIAARLGIPFYALNFEQEFERIIDYFVDEYARGRTPNPCVQCNNQLKFGRLLRYAEALGADLVATGHYARIVEHVGQPRLARALNVAKDQSYVLFGVPRSALRRCIFPLGEMNDKAQVRQIAAELGLRVHDKPDSQEICFVPNNDYRALLVQRRPDVLRPGALQTQEGQRVGTHVGVAAYTIGQRHGLGIALGKPAYVTHLDVLSNVVTVGPRDALLGRGLIAAEMNWHIDPPTAGGPPLRLAVKIRHMHEPVPGTATVCDSGRVEIRFDQPQPAVTPGQAAVLYDGPLLLGGGWIERALPPDAL